LEVFGGLFNEFSFNQFLTATELKNGYF